MWAEIVPIEVVAEFWTPPVWESMTLRLATSHKVARRIAALDRRRVTASARRLTKRSETAPCRGCGKTFDRRPHGWLREFCSDRCRVAHHNKRPLGVRPKAPPKVCPVCGGVVRAVGRRVYCSIPCRQRAEPPRIRSRARTCK